MSEEHEYTEEDYPYWEDYPIQYCAKCEQIIAEPVFKEFGGVFWKFHCRGKATTETIKDHTLRAKGKCLYCPEPFTLELMPQRASTPPHTRGLIATQYDGAPLATRSIKNGKIVCQCGQRIAWVDKHEAKPSALMKVAPTLLRETIAEPPADYDPFSDCTNYSYPMDGYYIFTALNFTNQIFHPRKSQRGNYHSILYDGNVYRRGLEGTCQKCRQPHFIEADERMTFLRRRVRELKAEK